MSKVELVNTATGERTDLRFAGGELSIRLGDVPPEIRAEFEDFLRQRRRIQERAWGVFGVPAHLLKDDRGA